MGRARRARGSRPPRRTAAAGSPRGIGALGRARLRPAQGRGHDGPPDRRPAVRRRPRRQRPVRRGPRRAGRARCVLGDSSAAGMGADEPWQTVGAIIANGVSALSGRPVRLTNVAVDRRASPPALDAPAGQRPGRGAAPGRRRHHDRRQRRDPPDRQVGRRAPPGPGGARRCATPAPRWSSAPAPTWAPSSRSPSRCGCWPRRWSRDLAAAQTVAVVEAGGRTVSLGDLLGPEFDERPHEMFSGDRFHPSPAGYARAAAALLPSVCAALGLWVGERRGARPTAVAARASGRSPSQRCRPCATRAPRSARPPRQARRVVRAGAGPCCCAARPHDRRCTDRARAGPTPVAERPPAAGAGLRAAVRTLPSRRTAGADDDEPHTRRT